MKRVACIKARVVSRDASFAIAALRSGSRSILSSDMDRVDCGHLVMVPALVSLMVFPLLANRDIR
jgi:hypothetical protein